MTLVIQLPETKEAALKAKAKALGVSAEQYAQEVLDRDLSAESQPVSALFREIWSDMPDDVRTRIPKDGATSSITTCMASPRENRERGFCRYVLDLGVADLLDHPRAYAGGDRRPAWSGCGEPLSGAPGVGQCRHLSGKRKGPIRTDTDVGAATQ